MRMSYKLFVGEPSPDGKFWDDGPETSEFKARLPIKPYTEGMAFNVGTVLFYVADLMKDYDVNSQWAASKVGNDITFGNGVQKVIAKVNAKAIREEVFTMLVQYMVFACLYTNSFPMTDVSQMLAYYEGDTTNIKATLTAYVPAMEYYIDVMRTAGLSWFEDVYIKFKQYLEDLTSGNAPNAVADAIAFYEDAINSRALNEASMYFQLNKGFLQVYVRDLPGSRPSPFSEYINAFQSPEMVVDATNTNPLRKTGNPPRVNLSVYGTPQGAFSDAFIRNESNDDVGAVLAKDMNQLIVGRDVVIFGFGYSGSGKTYTLMGNGTTQGAIAVALQKFSHGESPLVKISLKRVYFESIQYKFKPNPEKGKKKNYGNIRGKQIFLYSDDDRQTLNDPIYFFDDMTISSGPSTDTTNYESNSDNRDKKRNEYKNKFNQKDVTDLSGSSVNAFIRHIVDVTENYLKDTLRIRPTPNNKNSSRVHTYFQFELTFKHSQQDIISTLTVIDMAGRETPDSILTEFGQNLGNIKDQLDFLVATDPKNPPTQFLSNFNIHGLNAFKESSKDRYIDIVRYATLIALRKSLPDTAKQEKYVSYIRSKFINTETDVYRRNGIVPQTTDTTSFSKFSLDNEIKKMYPSSYPVFYTIQHIIATYVEGVYINASLDAMLAFFRNRQSNNRVQESKEDAGKKEDELLNNFNVETPITQRLLNALDTKLDGNQMRTTKFIMVSHVRSDRPKGMKETLQFSSEVSASMPNTTPADE